MASDIPSDETPPSGRDDRGRDDKGRDDKGRRPRKAGQGGTRRPKDGKDPRDTRNTRDTGETRQAGGSKARASRRAGKRTTRDSLDPGAILRDWGKAIVAASEILASPPFRLAGRSPRRLKAGELASIARGFPVVGLGIGLLAGLVHALAAGLGLPPVLAALFAVAALAFLGGASSEGGLARAAQALASGASRSERHAILKAESFGGYAVLSLILAIGFRVACLAAIAQAGGSGAAVAALAAAMAASYGALPAVLYLVPAASKEGFAGMAGHPRLDQAILSCVLGATLALLFLGPWAGLVALLIGALGAAKFAWLAHRKFGGLTGDLMGAAQLGAELGILLAIVALL